MPKDTFFNLPEDKRTRIMDAAIDRFSKSHYRDVTIDSIVKAAGIPKGSFYQYFLNKDDLYVYLFTEAGETKIDLFRQLEPEISEISFREYMMRYIQSLKTLEGSSPRIEQLKRQFLDECPQEIKKQILREEMPRSVTLFQKVIKQYVHKGEFRQGLDSKTAAYVTVMGISNLEYYPLAAGEQILSVLQNTIDFLVESMQG